MNLLLVACTLLAVTYSVNGDGHSQMLRCSQCFTYWFKQGQDSTSEFGRGFVQGVRDFFTPFGGNNTNCMMAGGSFASVECSTYCAMGYSTDHYEYNGESIKYKVFGRWCAEKNNTAIKPGCVYKSDFYTRDGEMNAKSFGGSFQLHDLHMCYCKDKDYCNNMEMPEKPKMNTATETSYNGLLVAAVLLAVFKLFK